MRIIFAVIALTATGTFGQVGTQGDVNIDDELYTCMNSCMCSCISNGYGSIILGSNNTSSEEPESEEPVSGQNQSEPQNRESISNEPETEAPISEEQQNEGPASTEPAVTNEPKTEAPTSEESGFKYNFAIKRIYTIVDPNNVITMEELPQPKQDIVYGETVNANNTLMMDVAVYNYNTRKYVYEIARDDAISACDEYESGTWNDVVVRITNTGLMPFGKCPVQAGTYVVSENYEISAKFDEQLDCGKYQLTTNTYAHERYILQSFFEWTISDNCV